MKKTLAMLMACAMTAASLAGCAPADKTQTTAATETAAPETSAAETTAEETTAETTTEARGHSSHRLFKGTNHHGSGIPDGQGF